MGKNYRCLRKRQIFRKRNNEIARQKIIPVEFYQRKYLDELAGTPDHQGVIGPV